MYLLVSPPFLYNKLRVSSLHANGCKLSLYCGYFSTSSSQTIASVVQAYVSSERELNLY